MRYLYTFLVLFVFVLEAAAQDVHLTQYYTSNISLNPAYTGNYYGDIRAVANARSQWGQVSTPIRTNMFSVEKKIHRYPDEIGVGLLVVNDQVSAYHFHTNKALAAVSYQKDINKNYIRAGLQAGMVFRSIDLGGQSFPDQWNYPLGIFDPSKSSGESNLQNSYLYPDISAGAAWTRRFGAAKVTAGYGIFHLNHPQDGFVRGGKGLPFRHAFNSSVIYTINPQVSIIPHLLYMRTAKATDFIFGANANKMLKENLGVLLGGGYRGSTINSDAVIGTAGFIYKRFQFGVSMDFTVSQLNQDARSKSAWELMITYTTPSRIPGKVTLPCDRY